VAEYNRADERIRWLAGFPEMNLNLIAGMDAEGAITLANPATQKILRELFFFENPSLSVPDGKEEILPLHTESTGSRLYREITLNTGCFSEHIVRIRKLQDVNFRSNFFYQTYMEEMKRLTGKDLAIGTSKREGD
jgi:hypothetical protein